MEQGIDEWLTAPSRNLPKINPNLMNKLRRSVGGRARQKIYQTVEVCAFTRHAGRSASVMILCESMSSAMRRTFVSALVASVTAACAASALVPLRAHAGPVDADWQLAYDGSGVFTDETGQPVIARAYQPTPTYSQQVPLPPPGYRSAPAYYQPAPAPQ